MKINSWVFTFSSYPKSCAVHKDAKHRRDAEFAEFFNYFLSGLGVSAVKIPSLKYKMLLNITVILSSFLFILSCSYSATSNWHFTGHVADLILLETDVPPGWEIERVTKEPMPGLIEGTVIYDAPPDAFGTNSLIRHSIMVFDEGTDAKEFLEADYQQVLELEKQVAASIGLQQQDFTPPLQYTYKSPVANELKIIYALEMAVPTGVAVGYQYRVWARYGNVVSYFVTIVADEEQTQVEAGEANVLSWQEVERLLQVIDKRVAKVQAGG